MGPAARHRSRHRRRIAWQVPLGDAPQLAARGITGAGTPILGGSVATAGGLVFIGGANDRQLPRVRREDRTSSGTELPASGRAPRSSMPPASSHEMVVIAAGGGGRFSPRSPTRLSPSRSASKIGQPPKQEIGNRGE
jgi:quinoprotein glucose dehydrogenase